jgi:hypothetical protein
MICSGRDKIETPEQVILISRFCMHFSFPSIMVCRQKNGTCIDFSSRLDFSEIVTE